MPDLFDRILDAVVARLRGLGLEGIGSRVYREKVPDEPNWQVLPSVLVSYLDQAEQHGGGDWKADAIGYPVLVQLYAGTLREHDAAGEARELAWLGAIDDALRNQRLDAVAEVTTIMPEPRTVLEAALVEGPEIQRSSKLYRVWVRRARASA